MAKHLSDADWAESKAIVLLMKWNNCTNPQILRAIIVYRPDFQPSERQLKHALAWWEPEMEDTISASFAAGEFNEDVVAKGQSFDLWVLLNNWIESSFDSSFSLPVNADVVAGEHSFDLPVLLDNSMTTGSVADQSTEDLCLISRDLDSTATGFATDFNASNSPLVKSEDSATVLENHCTSGDPVDAIDWDFWLGQPNGL